MSFVDKPLPDDVFDWATENLHNFECEEHKILQELVSRGDLIVADNYLTVSQDALDGKHLPNYARLCEYVKNRIETIRNWNYGDGKPASFGDPVSWNELPKFELARQVIEKRFIRNGDCEEINLLDVGCFTGYFTREMHKRYNIINATGIDIQKDLMTFLMKQDDTCAYVYENAEELKPSEWTTFDVITVFDVLERCFKPEKVVENLKQMLSERGVIIFNIPQNYKYNDDSKEVLRAYNESEVTKLFPDARFLRCSDGQGRPTFFGWWKA